MKRRRIKYTGRRRKVFPDCLTVQGGRRMRHVFERNRARGTGLFTRRVIAAVATVAMLAGVGCVTASSAAAEDATGALEQQIEPKGVRLVVGDRCAGLGGHGRLDAAQGEVPTLHGAFHAQRALQGPADPREWASAALSRYCNNALDKAEQVAAESGQEDSQPVEQNLMVGEEQPSEQEQPSDQEAYQQVEQETEQETRRREG